MIKRQFLNILWLVCIITTSGVCAQNISGVVNYRGVINEKYVDSFLTALKGRKDISMQVKQIVINDYRNATPDDFILNFKNEESYYYHIPSLAYENGGIGSNSDKSPYYTNNKTNTIIDTSPSLGSVSHKPLDWKITQETKKIGKYMCYKAIAIERLYSRQGHYYNEKAVAWFTPEIPVSFGPSCYSGLPGLVLQVERNEFTLTATKVNLNPDEKDIKIKRIGANEKVVTEEESHARIKEMTEARKKEYGG